MYKNYLTYQFAVGFERACSAVELPIPEKNELLRCAKNMINFLTRSLYIREDAEKCKQLYVSLTYLRDCHEILRNAKADLTELQGPYMVLQGRIEQMCLDASAGEKGQLRMLG